MYSNRGENEWRSPSAIALQHRFHNKADDLFSLGKMQKRLCTWMKEKTDFSASDVNDISRFLLSSEYEFARMLLRSRAESLGEIKKDVETVFGVKVVDVRTTNCPVKNKSFRGNAGRMSQYKKAYVLVANGMKIDFGEKVEAK